MLGDGKLGVMHPDTSPKVIPLYFSPRQLLLKEAREPSTRRGFLIRGQ